MALSQTTQRRGFIARGKCGDPESVYDTYTLLNTDNASQLMFQTFAGRSLALTNMTDAGKLPTGKSLTVHNFNTYQMMPTVLTNAKMLKLFIFLAGTTVEFIKENRAPSFTKTLQMLLGPSVLLQHVPTTAGDSIQSPQPFYRGRLKINTRSLDLGANQTFVVRLTQQVTPDADLNGLQVKFELEGLMSKKVTT
jgi:hypothetical protein